MSVNETDSITTAGNSIYSLKALNHYLSCFSLFPYRPDIVNYGSLRPNQHEANLNNAFNVAEESLGIAKLLDAEGMIIFLYTFFNIFFFIKIASCKTFLD